jgi:hypothetical protein
MSGIMIFCREVQYSAGQHIYKQNYEITAVQEEDSYFQIRTSIQDGTLILLFPFLKSIFGIWD